MKRAIISFILILFSVLAFSQTVEVRGKDTLVVMNVDEFRTTVKMSEDLKLTKKELSLADSIITHKDTVISLVTKKYDEEHRYLIERENYWSTKLATEKKKAKKRTIIGIAGGTLIGIVIGLVGGLTL